MHSLLQPSHLGQPWNAACEGVHRNCQQKKHPVSTGNWLYQGWAVLLALLLRQQHEIAFRDLTTAKENDFSPFPCFWKSMFLLAGLLMRVRLFVIPTMICRCAAGASHLPDHVLVSLLYTAGEVFVFTGTFVYKWYRFSWDYIFWWWSMARLLLIKLRQSDIGILLKLLRPRLSHIIP